MLLQEVQWCAGADLLSPPALTAISRLKRTDPLWIKTNFKCLYAVANPPTALQTDRQTDRQTFNHAYIMSPDFTASGMM